MKKQPIIAALPVLVLALIAVAVPALAQTQQFNSCVENEGADIAVTLPTSFNTAIAALPDPFLMMNGTRMTTKEQWKQRRQETLRLLERTFYGTKPPKPTTVTGTITNTKITVNVSEGGKNASFSGNVSLPSGTGPFPVVICYGSMGGADPTSLKSWGVATITFDVASVGSESGTRTNKTGAFYTIYGAKSTTGLLAAWAWGVSRFIDVIQQSDGKILKWDAVGVTGCSRWGKGAFVAGVLDQRVALTIPMESGSGGMNVMRSAIKDAGAQSPNSAYTETYWLGDDFSPFTSKPENLPIDMHQAVALVAPRGFFVMDKTAASAGQWLNIPSSQRAAKGGVEVYKALGVGGNFYYMNTPTDAHCSGANNYNTQLKDFVEKFLLRTKAPGTTPTFTENNPPDMSTWINWTTPTLSGSLNIGGCRISAVAFKLTTTVSPLLDTPEGSGKVTSSPAGTNGIYDSATVVKLTAVPASGYKFKEWSGDAAGTKDTVSVTMNAPKTVTAIFELSNGTGVRNAASSAKRFSGLTAATSGSALNVSFNAKNSGATLLKLYSLKGDLISSASINTVAGNNYSHTFNAAKMPSGYYVVSLYNDGRTVEQARVVVP
jgi:hypothetical protein